MSIEMEDQFVIFYHLKHGYEVVTTTMGERPEDVIHLNPGVNNIEGANGLFYSFNSEDVVLITVERA